MWCVCVKSKNKKEKATTNKSLFLAFFVNRPDPCVWMNHYNHNEYLRINENSSNSNFEFIVTQQVF